MAMMTDIAAVPIEPEYCCSMLKRALPSAMCMTSSCCRPMVMELLYIMLKPVIKRTWKMMMVTVESFWAKTMKSPMPAMPKRLPMIKSFLKPWLSKSRPMTGPKKADKRLPSKSSIPLVKALVFKPSWARLGMTNVKLIWINCRQV